ncbi:MAG: HAMP domain-containing protein [Clostridiales bacterium]|nr:HAMP domain-containing protein [Clostridiales bacterium]
MNGLKSIKARVSGVTAVTILLGIAALMLVLYLSLRSHADQTARDILEKTGEHYIDTINDAFSYPSKFARIIASDAAFYANTLSYNRVLLSEKVLHAFLQYPDIDRLSIMFEPNAYDGLDNLYAGTNYGAQKNGRVSFYYLKTDGQARFVNGVKENEEEFTQDYYCMPFQTKKTTISEPRPYATDGSAHETITVSEPVFNSSSEVIGVVTADIFLEKLFNGLKDQKLFSTGYMILTNANGTVIYSPVQEHTFKNKKDVGLDYHSSPDAAVYADTVSIVNGQKSLEVTLPVKLSDMEETFYLSIIAPYNEINAATNRMITTSGLILLTVSIALITITYITVSRALKPVNNLVSISQKISEGNFDVENTIFVNDEIGILSGNFSKMIGVVNHLITDLEELSSMHNAGHMDFSLNPEDYTGVYMRLVENSNRMARNYADRVGEAIDVAQRFANGNFDVDITDYPNDMSRLSSAMLLLKENLLAVRGEINQLVISGAEGELSNRAGVDSFNGNWKDLLTGLNRILDSVIKPIEESRAVMKEMAAGNFSVMVTGDYKGGYAQMKESLNSTVRSINNYIVEITRILGDLAGGDLCVGIERQYKGQFKNIGEFTGKGLPLWPRKCGIWLPKARMRRKTQLI